MKIYRWEEYQKFFQLIILRYLIVWFALVPAVAGFIGQFPDPLQITISGIRHEIELKLPFSWQLLWISSLFFVIALGIYKTFCPNFILKYNNFSDYCSHKHHPRWLAWEAHQLLKIANKAQKEKFKNRLLEKKYITEAEKNIDADLCDEPMVLEKQTEIQFKVEGISYKFGMPVLGRDNLDESEKDIFYEIFGRYSDSQECARKIIMGLLIASLALFLIVFLQHIYSGGIFVWAWASGLIYS